MTIWASMQGSCFRSIFIFYLEGRGRLNLKFVLKSLYIDPEYQNTWNPIVHIFGCFLFSNQMAKGAILFFHSIQVLQYHLNTKHFNIMYLATRHTSIILILDFSRGSKYGTYEFWKHLIDQYYYLSSYSPKYSITNPNQ